MSTDSVANRLYAQDRLPALLLNVAAVRRVVSISGYLRETLHLTGSPHEEYPGAPAATPRPVREGTRALLPCAETEVPNPQRRACEHKLAKARLRLQRHLSRPDPKTRQAQARRRRRTGVLRAAVTRL